MNQLTKPTGRLKFTLVIGVATIVAGCGADWDHTPQDGTPDAEVVGEVAQPYALPTIDDVPAMAAIARVDHGVEDLWVFACGSNGHIIRNIKPNYRNEPGNDFLGWDEIATSKSCTAHSPPTVGKWAGETPAETVLLYWQDDNNDLIEVRFYPDGHTSTTNLSVAALVGKLAGAPVIAQTSNTTGAIQAVSIAIIRQANNGLMTLDFTGGTWHRRFVRRADGTQAIARVFDGIVDQPLAAYSAVPGAGFPKPMLSQLVNNAGGTSAIFSRSFWTREFTERAIVVDNNKQLCGKIALGGSASVGDACGQHGCAMVQFCPDGHLFGGSLDNTGNITIKVKEMDPAPGSATSKSTLYSVSDGGNESRLGVMKGNLLGNLVAVYYGTYESFPISFPGGPENLTGAPILANSALRQVFYTRKVGTAKHLQYIDLQDLNFFPAPVDLGPILQ
jgi:hypothetical protein